MSEKAAKLIRFMDRVIDEGGVGSRNQVEKLYKLAGRVWDAVYPSKHYYLESHQENRWPAVMAALGSEPLRHKRRIFELIGAFTSGAFPKWFQRWR